MVAIQVPNVGPLSRRERDEFKALGQERGLRVFDDLKRLERDFPQAVSAMRQQVSSVEDDLLVVAAWAGEPKGVLPDQTVLLACGQLRLFLAQKYNDRLTEAAAQGAIGI